MAVDEQYLRVRRTLEEKLGVEEASYLMDRPVGGWSELVTNHTLDLKFATIDARFAAVDARFAAVDARFDSIEKRIDALDRRLESIDQRLAGLSWQLVGAVIAGMGVMGGLFAVLVLVAGN
jgi:tetrahydromethanopterin S-methyltransferase subunit G